ncbi:MAG: MBL fold metallo-hydrolase, partial [Rhizobiaceae bacterium]|nr:MBL fold metallo-hydrolase [Rhizobiaceae bacterium]
MIARLTLISAFAFTLVASGPASAQSAPQPVSKCLAMVDATPHMGPEILPPVLFAKADAAPLPVWNASGGAGDVKLTYIDHSVWAIQSPEGIVAATDYYGLPMTPMPVIATMNNAHRTHWTPNPDPSIRHVLRGWSPDGVNPASHAIVEGDMFVR